MKNLSPPHSLRAFQARASLLLGCLAGLLAGVPASATTVVPPEFDQLVNESDYIVRAVVKSVTSEFRAKGTGRKIYTSVEVEVREVIAGTPPVPLVLVMLGGQVGDEVMTLEGAPQFKVGDEDILFVRDNGRTIFPLFAIMHGRYPILKEKGTKREYVARSNQVPLQDTAEVVLPLTDGAASELQRQTRSTESALTPDQFVQRVKSAVNPAYRRDRKK